MKILSGSSNQILAEKIALELNIPLVKREISSFKNQEIRVFITDEVKGEDVCLIQSFSAPVDSNIMETLLMVDALERMGVKNVLLAAPWLGYSLQDKVFRNGEPIAAKVIAEILSNTYFKRAILLDLHNSSIPGFFNMPTEHLTAVDLFADHIKSHYNLQDSIVVSPDFGGLKSARSFSGLLGLDLANIDKHRDLKTGQVSAMGLHGDVQNKIVFIFDDVIMSGGTVVKACLVLKDAGAREVHFLASHGVFCDNALDKIIHCGIDSVTITNSIYHQILPNFIQVLDISKLISEALKKWI